MIGYDDEATYLLDASRNMQVRPTIFEPFYVRLKLYTERLTKLIFGKIFR